MSDFTVQYFNDEGTPINPRVTYKVDGFRPFHTIEATFILARKSDRPVFECIGRLNTQDEEATLHVADFHISQAVDETMPTWKPGMLHANISKAAQEKLREVIKRLANECLDTLASEENIRYMQFVNSYVELTYAANRMSQARKSVMTALEKLPDDQQPHLINCLDHVDPYFPILRALQHAGDVLPSLLDNLTLDDTDVHILARRIGLVLKQIGE